MKLDPLIKNKKWAFGFVIVIESYQTAFFVKETFPIGFNDFSEIKGQFVQFLEFYEKDVYLV